MHRRRLLAGVTTSAAALAGAGCLGRLERTPTRPERITDSEFETDVETETGRIFGPKITAEQEAATVTIEGVSEYGSSSCGYLRLEDLDYDAERAVLQVDVGSGQDDPADEERYCDDDVGADSYRVVVRFDDGIPAQVEAKQTFGRENTETFD